MGDAREPQHLEVPRVVADVEGQSDGAALDEAVERGRAADAEHPQRGALPEPGRRAAVLGHEGDAVALVQGQQGRQPLLELVGVARRFGEEGDHPLRQGDAGQLRVLAEPVRLATGQEPEPSHQAAAAGAGARVQRG